MQHIFVNFKRFDIPVAFGGVNRAYPFESYGKYIIENTVQYLSEYKGKAEFVDFFPEMHLLSAVSALKDSGLANSALCSSPLDIGAQGVYRYDTAIGGNFGAFTTNRPASSVVSSGCKWVLIGHCEERNDKNELLSLGGNTDRNVVNRVLQKEVKAAVDRGLKVLYCVGEKSEEVSAWDSVIKEQLETGLEGIDLSSVIVAYEPVWSIGPGKIPAGKGYIEKVARLIKSTIGDVPVVYGGGLKEENAAMLASIDEIDGGLIALTRFTGDIGFYLEEYFRIVELYMSGKAQKLAQR